jgi:hypothetical protein
MAFIAPVIGIGGGALGSLALGALGIGIQLAAAYFFPQKVVGPRKEDLKAQTSRYGDYIPRVHGVARTAGAIAWLRNDHIDETKTVEQPVSIGAVLVSYSYRCTIILVFAHNGPIKGITRLWGEDKLCLDISAETLEDAINGATVLGTQYAEGAEFSFYIGSDTQESDPDYEADRTYAPAWPGIAYIKIKDFPLDRYGQRIPNFEAEVIKDGSARTFTVNPPDDLSTVRFDSYDNRYVTLNGGELSIHSVPDFRLLVTITLESEVDNGPYITRFGEICVAATNGNSIRFYDLNGNLIGDVDGRRHWDGSFLGGEGVFAERTVDQIKYMACIIGNNLRLMQREAGIGWINSPKTTILRCSNLELYYTAIVPFAGTQPPRGMVLTPKWLYAIKRGSGANDIIKIDCYQIPGEGGFVCGSGEATYYTVEPPVGSGDIVAIDYSQNSDEIILLCENGLYIYGDDMDAVLRSVTGAWTVSVGSNYNSRILSSRDTVIVKADNNDVYEYRIIDLELYQYVDASTADWELTVNDHIVYLYNAKYDAIFAGGIGSAGPHVWFMPRLGRDGVPLKTVIARECAYVDVPSDVSAIPGEVTVRGYAVRDSTSPRGAIEDLARVFFFDFVQSAGALKFFMRNATPAFTLGIEYQGFSSGELTPRRVVERYTNPEDIPAGTAISYISIDGDYRSGNQAITKPNGIDTSSRIYSYQTSVVLTDDEAAQAADILYDELQDASTIYQVSVGPRFAKYHPGDVLLVELNEERAVPAVLTSARGRHQIDWELRGRSISYTSSATGTPVIPNTDSILDNARSDVVLMDSHLLRPVDDSDSFYMTVYPVEDGRFTSATVFKSIDSGVSYFQYVGFQDGALVGRALTVLPDRPHPWSFDRVSSLTFTVASERGVAALPVTCTEADLLADRELNAFAVRSGSDWEIVQAATIVNNGDGTWTISTFLRGRQGTEFAMPNHAIGNMVVHLTLSTMARAPDGDMDIARSYLSITTGKIFDTTYSQIFTNTSRGLRPWSPVHVEAERDGSDNLTVTAIRRDRKGTSELVDDPPMSEASESYRMDIYDGVDVVRSVSGSSLSFAYSAANQTTDFGSPQSAIDIQIVQISATFGDGVPAIATV